MRKLLSLTLIVLAVSSFTALAQSRSEESLYLQLTTNGVNSAAISALARVLKEPEDFSAGILYMACDVAFRKKRLEDAGFLLYVARFRTRFDNALFPPTGTGGNSPMLALGAIHQELGAAINPAMTGDPEVYAKVLERIKSWKPKVTPTYEPGWEYSNRKSTKQAEDETASNRKQVIDHMTGFSMLLQDTNYFAACRIVQSYNFSFDSATNRPSKTSYEAAIQKMEQIEKQKGIDGIASVINKSKSSNHSTNESIQKPDAQKPQADK